MGASVKLVLLATSASYQGISPALVPVGGQSILTYWLNSLKHCARLLPPHDKVFIVTSPSTHDAFVDWASNRDLSMGGFHVSNLIQFTESTGESAPLNELQFALEVVPSLQDGWVVVASLDHFLGSNLDLQRFVEHSIIRGKDTLLYTIPPPNRDMEQQTEVSLAGPDVNPRVQGLNLQPRGCADGVSTAALAPMALLRPYTLPMVADLAVQTTVTGTKQLGVLFSALLEAAKPVHAMQLDMAIDCSSAYGQAYTSAFIRFFQEEIDALQKRGPAAQALDEVTAIAQENATISRGHLAVEQLMHSVSPAKRSLLRFDALAEQRMAAEATVSHRQPQAARFGLKDLPIRLADASLQRHNPKQQHPVYETTANEIGRLAPQQMDMPDVYAGSTGHFTKTFAAPYKARGLITSLTTSKVHKLLDDF